MLGVQAEWQHVSMSQVTVRMEAVRHPPEREGEGGFISSVSKPPIHAAFQDELKHH